MRRANQAHKVIVPGMTLDQARTASAQLGYFLPAEPPNVDRVAFLVQGGFLAGSYRMIVHLDEASRIAHVDAPQYEADD
jgi:hypothetical protein